MVERQCPGQEPGQPDLAYGTRTDQANPHELPRIIIEIEPFDGCRSRPQVHGVATAALPIGQHPLRRAFGGGDLLRWDRPPGGRWLDRGHTCRRGADRAAGQWRRHRHGLSARRRRIRGRYVSGRGGRGPTERGD